LWKLDRAAGEKAHSERAVSIWVRTLENGVGRQSRLRDAGARIASLTRTIVSSLREIYDGPALAGFADRWKNDSPPWARLQIFEHLRMLVGMPRLHTVVKRLFEQGGNPPRSRVDGRVSRGV